MLCGGSGLHDVKPDPTFCHGCLPCMAFQLLPPTLCLPSLLHPTPPCPLQALTATVGAQRTDLRDTHESEVLHRQIPPPPQFSSSFQADPTGHQPQVRDMWT